MSEEKNKIDIIVKHHSLRSKSRNGKYRHFRKKVFNGNDYDCKLLC